MSERTPNLNATDAVEICAAVQGSAQVKLRHDQITPDTSLIQDLMFTSLSFIDLTLELEQRLGIDEFPMQEWMDEERTKGDAGFTVGSLIQKWRAVRATL